MAERVSAVTRSALTWGEVPDWIAALASACDKASQAKVAKRLGYSPATVSYVLQAKYPGDLAAVEQAVRGALMATNVDCPVVGELAADQCLAHQRAAYSAVNPQRIAFYRACRSGCPNSRLPRSDEGER
jgi:hypothetical protein